MAAWDRDLHRIQEIQRLLEDRQRYFCGQLNTSCYKVDSDGNPVFFPTLHSSQGHLPAEPSLGHSVEAHFGSSEGQDSIVKVENESGSECEGNNNNHSSSSSSCSEGHNGDESHNGSSSSDDDKREKVALKKVSTFKNKTRPKSRAKCLRRWVAKNLEGISSPESKPQNGKNKKQVGKLEPQKQPSTKVLQQKSVSFEKALPQQKPPLPEEKPVVQKPRKLRKRKPPDPMDLLKRRSWFLRAQVASRLGENDMNLSVLNSVTKGSLVYAREKLRKAEKNLQVMVNAELSTRVIKETVSRHRKPISTELPRPKPTTTVPYSKAGSSRLAIRQAEEALKSDLNLREAFAMIKINPDPIIRLASTEKLKCAEGGGGRGQTRSLAEGKFIIPTDLVPGFGDDDDDPITAESLRRLTKLSLEHKQKQKTMMHGKMQSLQIQKTPGSGSKPKTGPSSTRRKSSTSSSVVHQISVRKRSKDISANSSKLTFSGLEASIRAEKEFEGQVDNESYTSRSGKHSLDRLTGTII